VNDLTCDAVIGSVVYEENIKKINELFGSLAVKTAFFDAKSPLAENHAFRSSARECNGLVSI
jgi:nitrogen regulatory protein PII-like uncharacterized protein